MICRIAFATATAATEAEMLALGVKAEIARRAAYLFHAFPTDPEHGLGAHCDDPMFKAELRKAQGLWLAAQTRRVAA